MLNDWSNYFIAMTSAAATLTGLIFVGASISLQRILATPKLSNRAFESLLLLVIIVIVSTLMLVPKQTCYSLGIELIIIGVLVFAGTLKMDIGMLTIADGQYRRHYIRNLIMTQLAVVPYIIAAIVMLNYGEAGIYFLIPAFIFSFCKSLMDAWVLLIEINR